MKESENVDDDPVNTLLGKLIQQANSLKHILDLLENSNWDTKFTSLFVETILGKLKWTGVLNSTDNLERNSEWIHNVLVAILSILKPQTNSKKYITSVDSIIYLRLLLAVLFVYYSRRPSPRNLLLGALAFSVLLSLWQWKSQSVQSKI